MAEKKFYQEYSDEEREFEPHDPYQVY